MLTKLDQQVEDSSCIILLLGELSRALWARVYRTGLAVASLIRGSPTPDLPL